MAKTKVKSVPVTRAQIKHIHTLKTMTGLSEEIYRKALGVYFGVETSKHLTMGQAAEFISELKKLAKDRGLLKDRKSKYSELGNRYGMATPAQLRKIEAMWSGVSRQETPKQKEAALRKFLEKKFGISDIRFITAPQVKKVINALNNFTVPGPVRPERVEGATNGMGEGLSPDSSGEARRAKPEAPAEGDE